MVNFIGAIVRTKGSGNFGSDNGIRDTFSLNVKIGITTFGWICEQEIVGYRTPERTGFLPFPWFVFEGGNAIPPSGSCSCGYWHIHSLLECSLVRRVLLWNFRLYFSFNMDSNPLLQRPPKIIAVVPLKEYLLQH